jgi:hypothetical protein
MRKRGKCESKRKSEYKYNTGVKLVQQMQKGRNKSKDGAQGVKKDEMREGGTSVQGGGGEVKI